MLMACIAVFFAVACGEKKKEADQTNDATSQTLTMHRTKEDYDEAIANFINLLKREPDNVVLLIALGNTYFDVGRDMEAIEVYKKALEIYPDNVSVRTDLGTSYRRTGQTDKALQEYNRSLAIDPRHSITRYNVGVVYLWDKRDADSAIKAWEELLRIDPYFMLADEIRNNMSTLKKLRNGRDK